MTHFAGSPTVVDPASISLHIVPRRTIEDVAERIAAAFHPQRIILFGSYAHGTPTPDSDVDMLVVMETPVREIDQAVEIVRAIAPRFGLDLLVRTPANLARRLELGDPFLREVVHRGEVLYARAHS